MKHLILAMFCSIGWGGIVPGLWFEPNQGQAHSSVQFLARTSQGYVYLGQNQMAVHVDGKPVRMNLEGASTTAAASLEEPLGGISSYFSGRTEKDWHTGIPHYARVHYKEVYPGVDLVYYANGTSLEYDFRLKPHADPSAIRLAFNESVQSDANGDLLVGGFRQKRPKAYQNGREIACEYRIKDEHQVQLALSVYDHSQPLTVDPVLVFSTYLGGPGTNGGTAGIAVDSQRFVYLASSTQSRAEPTLNPFQQTEIDSLAPFILKMTPDGASVVYFVVLGGNGWDQSTGFALDSNGSAVVTGRTSSGTFPLKNAVQSQYKSLWFTGFFTKVSPDGRSLVYSTYFGGSNVDFAMAVGVDQQGNALFTGHTLSNDFPVLNAYQSTKHGSADCYLAKLSPEGSLIFSTLFGGSADDYCFGVTTDSGDNAYVVGSSGSDDLPLKSPIQTVRSPYRGYETPTLLKFSANGMPLIATFFGGPVFATSTSVTLDAAGDIFVAGNAWEPHFLTKNGFQKVAGGPQNAFLVKFSPDISIVFSTLLGGSGNTIALGVSVDSNGSAYLTGGTASADFPVLNSLQSFGGGVQDAYVTKFTPLGNGLVYSTFLGGNGADNGNGIAVDSHGNAFIVGTTNSNNFPTVNAFQPAKSGGLDAFLAEISDSTSPALSPLIPNPGRLLFSFAQGGTLPLGQSVTVSGGAFTVSRTAAWLDATLLVGGSVLATVNPTGLSPGVYNSVITLTPRTGPPASISVALTVLSPAPVLSSVDPSLVPTGSNSTSITIRGSGFAPDSIVQVASVSVPGVVFVDANTLRVTLPGGYFSAPMNITIAVMNPGSALSNILSLSVGTLAPYFIAASVVNAASYQGGAVAPGEIVAVFGSNFGTADNTKVYFNDALATLIYVTKTQLAATVPYSIAGSQNATMLLNSNGIQSVPVTLNVTDSVPAIFTSGSTGNGQAAALNQDNSVNGPSHPAAIGSVVVLFGTGGGALTADKLPKLALPVSVTIGGVPAKVEYAGIAPSLVQGVMQVNAKIPTGVAAGSSVPVVVTVGTAKSNTVTLVIR